MFICSFLYLQTSEYETELNFNVFKYVPQKEVIILWETKICCEKIFFFSVFLFP